LANDPKTHYPPLVGVLALQGDFEAHLQVLKKIGVDAIEVRTGPELDRITHLIIPGGESTTIRKVAVEDGYWEKLARFKGPVMGTCMGSILMASKIECPNGDGWGMLDITVRRNAYGRQIHSFTANGKVEFSENPFEMVFIRAPKIIRIAENVHPIAWLNNEITGVVCGNKMALTFHPELSGDDGFHRKLVGMG